MSWMPCPVCDQKNPPNSNRCTSCAADFTDPDVMAMMGKDTSSVASPVIDGGALTHSTILGVSEQGLENGTALRKLAFVGIALLAIGFLIPVSHNYVDSSSAWNALQHAPAIALLFPALAIAMGLMASFAPLLPWQRSVLLLTAGVIGLTTLPFLGHLSGSPEKFLPAILLGMLAGTWGLILRGFDAQSAVARKLTIAGAVLIVVGFLLPMSDAATGLPLEIRLFLTASIDSASPLSLYSEAFNRDPMIFFVIVFLFLPLLLIPIGAAIAFPKPSGAWDKLGLILKPITWIAILYLPLLFALFAFNLMGYELGRYILIDKHYLASDEFQSAAISGRIRLMLLATAFSLWATLPIVAVAKEFFSASKNSDAKLPSEDGEKTSS